MPKKPRPAPDTPDSLPREPREEDTPDRRRAPEPPDSLPPEDGDAAARGDAR